MKQSHLTTPRTMDEACFISGGDPIEHYRSDSDWQDAVVTALSLVALVALGAMMYSGWVK